MFEFSEKSERILAACHDDLDKVLREAIKVYDFSVIEGPRDKEQQTRYYNEGLSKVQFPRSKHNRVPSEAIHIAPYPISFSNRRKNLARFYFLAGVVKTIACQNGIKVRWGGDWDGDGDFEDQSFDDLMHFELI